MCIRDSMQCDEKRLMVEMDSQYNGAYCNMNKTGDVYPYDENRPYSYESWDYDNQLYFHKDQTYTGKNDYEKNFNPYEGTDGRDYAAYRNYKYACLLYTSCLLSMPMQSSIGCPVTVK